MIILPVEASDESILTLVRQWVNLLADERVEEAQDLLSTEGAERDWTPSLIRELLAAYEQELDFPSKVTLIEDTQVGDIAPRHEVTRWEAKKGSDVVGEVEFDLPINGIWSDLTALFWVKHHPEGLVLELYDIHVL